MRNAIQVFASTLLAVLVVLFAYWHAVYRPQQQKLLDEQQATQQKLQKVLDEQARMSKALDEQQEAVAHSREDGVVRDDFVRASSAMRTAIAEYYMTTAKWPATNQEAGLPAPSAYRGGSLQSATVSAEGAIEFVFDATSGVDGGRIRLAPDTSKAEAMGISWHCETTDYTSIRRVLPDCEFKPGPAQPLHQKTAKG
jgi:uncharacterized iron-regulated membrane protein